MVSVGIDEVGRGSWAGPLVAGAVILGGDIQGLRDSKQLSRLQREDVAAAIRTSNALCGLGWVSADEIDDLGLTKSVRLAYIRALQQLGVEPDEIIIDGNFNYLPHMPQARAIIRADSLVPAVSAASVLAKVARDRFMIEIARVHPGYGFERHVGYGTAQHRTALRRLGVSPQHRQSFRPVRDLCGLG